MFKFCKHQLWECSRTLADVAMGRRPADTVIRNARLVNVCTREIRDHTDGAIACGISAIRFTGYEDARQKLKEYGVEC